ncbi:hypothetical protein [Polaribacter atrinae]|uniref:Uncharacterized protein n=1 Tax=Polaribacter atrinae TaxID=1333662 RepID=A0A176TC63_9FLAO|nr:hypothetical protein [Polaribacter atrinae]OAD45424.1 hypothetical protein LPB303_06635 [Polaribacter atrinae]
MRHTKKIIERLKKSQEVHKLESEKIESREITNKLKLKSVISPKKIYRLFKKFLIVPYDGKTPLLSGFIIDTKFERRIINSILLSFEFDKKRHPKFSYKSRVTKYDTKYPFIYLKKHPILENLTAIEINNIRAIIIIMQNEKCFNNFNPLLASKIIANNFYCEEKNSNNSVANNRKIFNQHFIKGSKNSSKYTPISSAVKLHKIKHNFK